MFNLPHKQLFIEGLFEIEDNYCCLLNDGDNDLLYIGTNKYGSKIIGSIVFEDDERLFIRYIQTILTDDVFYNFLNTKITLRDVFLKHNQIFVLDKNYQNETIDKDLISLKDFPNDYLPLENSFCPDFVKRNSLDYTFSLKGKLADLHKAEPLVMSSINSKIYSLLNSTTEFLNEINITTKIYSEVALAGSFKLNFEIELIESANLFSKSSDDIKKFIFDFLKFIFDKLPNEPNDSIINIESATEEFKKIYLELHQIYEIRNLNKSIVATEQKAIDLVTYSVDAFKDIDYLGFDRIEISNTLKGGEVLPVALINTDYYDSVSTKVFKPDQGKKSDIITLDDTPSLYKIQVYSLNKESGNGGAYYQVEQSITKIAIHLKGKSDFHGTVFTKSLDENKIIEIKGIGKRVNNILKEITINL
jgi:hypothetical protein